MKVSDLAPEELKTLIEEAVEKKLKEILLDPDEGLELREEVKEKLIASLSSKKRIPFEEVKRGLGIN